MKIKRLIGTLAITAAITALTVTAGAAPALHLYPNAAEIVEIDRTSDLVTCSDGAGNLWAFWGSEDYETGDMVALIMDSRGTSDIRDDAIVAVRYAGSFNR